MANLYVDSSRGNDATGSGTSKKPFKTITHALRVARAGDTLKVRLGLYDERNGESFPIKMKPDVDLRGLAMTAGGGALLRMIRGPDGNMYSLPLIYGGNSVDFESGLPRFVAVTGADRASISNFVVFTVNGPAEEHGVGILCDSTSPTIRENVFGGDGHAGITLLGTAQPQIEDNRFHASFRAGSGSARISFALFSMDWGVTAHGESQPTIQRNYFACSNGIDITQDSCSVVTENTIVCTTAGIRIQNETSPTISGNKIAGHAGSGIIMNDAPRPLIEHNWIAENGSGRPGDGGVVIYHEARPDLGGGARGGSGGNTIQHNNPYDLYNRSGNEIYALDNTWTHETAHDIDARDIYDDEENPSSGRVHF